MQVHTIAGARALPSGEIYVFFSSPIVRLPRASEATGLVAYTCGWIPRTTPWLIVTYRDEADNDLDDRGELKDLLIGPMELASILSEFSTLIANAALVQPEAVPSPHCVFSPVTELWLSEDDRRSAIIVITPSGRHLFQSSDAPRNARDLRKVFPSD